MDEEPLTRAVSMRRRRSILAVLVAVLFVIAPAAAEAAFVPSVRERVAELWAVGDGADGGGTARELGARIAAEEPDRFLYLGDVYEDGTYPEFLANYRSVYGALDRIAAPTVGNHEWDLRREGYLRYWREAKGRRAPLWYGFRAAGWQVLSLASEAPAGPRSRQHRWLERRLGKRTKLGNCRVAFWHRPRFSAGPSGDHPDLEPLRRLLEGRARVLIAGHDHDMQRHRPQAGLTQFVAGSGGHNFRGLDMSDPRLAFARDFTAGALRLRLRRERLAAAFVSSDGSVLDRRRIRCRRR